MIETYHPALTTARLVAVLREEIKRNHTPGSAGHPSSDVLEILLKVAEDKSVERKRMPKKLDRFPFTWSKRLQRIFLKVYALLFADQRDVNLVLIKALRQALSLIRALQTKADFGSRLHLPDSAPQDAGSFHELYAELEDRFLGTEEANKKRLITHLSSIQQACGNGSDAVILDLGCGRGDWLELLQEQGLHAQGVDVNPVRVQQCRNRGLQAQEGDLIAYLRAHDDENVAAVTCFHVAEHLTFDALVHLLDEMVRVLRPGGLALFELPEVGPNLSGSYYSYQGPAGRHPLPRHLMRFLAEARGLQRIELQEVGRDYTLQGWKD